MRTTRILVFAGVVAGTIVPPAWADDTGISIRQLAGPIYVVVDSHFVSTNSLFYIGPRTVTVIGATWTPETARLLAAQIKRVTDRPIGEVIDTSPDPEWSGGNSYWKSIGAKIVAIRQTSDLLERTWADTVETARRNHPGYPASPLTPPTEVHTGNFELQDGNIRVLYLGPSHTAGDVFVYFPKERVLDAGSILKEELGNLAKADVAEYPKTLRRLQDLHLDIGTVIAGHWSAVHGPELIDRYLQLLSEYRK